MDQPIETTQPSLNISDLQAVVELIDACTQRGAFRAEELVQVGTLYSRIREFVTSVQPASAESESDSTTEVSTND